MKLCLMALMALGLSGPNYLPNPALTPGAVDARLTKEVICANGWSTKSVRKTSAKLKASVYQSYGITSYKAGQYEIDHLISLEIGGADVKANLWPQPYGINMNGLNLGAHTKDKVENAMHKAVCDGKISLSDAQKMIATDWTVAYIKFVGPLPGWSVK